MAGPLSEAVNVKTKLPGLPSAPRQVRRNSKKKLLEARISRILNFLNLKTGEKMEMYIKEIDLFSHQVLNHRSFELAWFQESACQHSQRGQC